MVLVYQGGGGSETLMLELSRKHIGRVALRLAFSHDDGR
jgi:hypothetical protein